MRTTLMMAGCLIAVGCSSTTSEQLAGSQSNARLDEIICTSERPIGSHIPRRVCRSRGEIEKQVEETRKVLETMPRTDTPQ